MNHNYKLYFKYILLSNHQLFINSLLTGIDSLYIYTYQLNLYFISLHLKLSSLFYGTQLIDLFVYECPSPSNKLIESSSHIASIANSISVYNFHNITTQTRFFFFFIGTKNSLFHKSTSIAELFNNANWLEREAGEMHGLFFYGKKDLRNLLLPYGDTSSPMLKHFPSIGTRELYYDITTDLIIQQPVTLQF